MRRGKRRAVDASEMLDEIDDGRAVTADERLRLNSSERIIRAFNWEQNREHVNGIMRDRRRNHHGPECEALPPRVEDRREKDEEKKIRHVCKLHEIVKR